MKQACQLALVGLVASGCILLRPMPIPPEPWTSPTGLVVVDLVEPEGRPVEPGDRVSVHYELRLESGEVIDSSRDRGLPIEFTVGEGQVVPGFEEAVTGMVPGGIRRVVLPPELGYGAQGVPGMIPPDAKLTFLVELMDIIPPEAE